MCKANDSRALAGKIMDAVAGRVSSQFGRMDRILWDSEKKRHMCLGDKSIPVENLIENMTDHEIHNLQRLPVWNGNNGYEITMICRVIVGAAIARHAGPWRGSDRFPSHVPVDEQMLELWECRCVDCARTRAANES